LGLAQNSAENVIKTQENAQKPGFSRLFIENPANSDKKSSNFNEEKADIVNFGIICLISAIGDEEILGINEENDEIFEKIREFYEKKDHELCCFLHNWSHFHKKGPDFRIFPLIFLEKRGFSQEFCDFLCQCLQFDKKKRADCKTLMKHPLFQKKKKEPEVLMKELMKIHDFYAENPEKNNENDAENEKNNEKKPEKKPEKKHEKKHDKNAEENFQRKNAEKTLKKLCDGIRLVLPNSEKWFQKEEYTGYLEHLKGFNEENEVFRALELEFGIPSKEIYMRIKEVFTSFEFVKKFLR